MDRLHTIDREIANCLELLRGMVPSSTQNANVNMAMASQHIMQAMIQYHQEKMHILQEITNAHMPLALVTPNRPTEEEVNTYWGPNHQEWTDAQPRDNAMTLEELSASVTVREPRRRLCVRTYVATDGETLNKLHDQPCNVCFETYTINDMCVTDCGHDFCKSCFRNWELSGNALGNVTCPSCRAHRPRVAEYTTQEMADVMSRSMDVVETP